MISIIFLLALSFSTSHVGVHGFCVADLKGSKSPAGFSCKSYASINDFVFSGFRAGNTSNAFKFAFTPANVNQLPGLNGLGVAAARLDMETGGVVPLHSHPDASEILLVVQGHITAGFIASDNSVFVKSLTKGDVMVLPQGLLHFELNSGGGKASAYLTFSSENPSAQLVDLALFGSSLDSALVGKTTLLDPAQIKKLKGIFGGSN